MVAFAVDEALAAMLSLQEARIAKRGRPPEGTVWATEADYDDELPTAPVVVPFPELLEVDDAAG